MCGCALELLAAGLQLLINVTHCIETYLHADLIIVTSPSHSYTTYCRAPCCEQSSRGPSSLHSHMPPPELPSSPQRNEATQ